MITSTENDWPPLSNEEKQQELFFKQKSLLDTFLEHNAISQDQHDKCLKYLVEKIGVRDFLELVSCLETNSNTAK